MKKVWLMAVMLSAMGLMLIAASSNDGLPINYFQLPQAISTTTNKAHADLRLVDNMRPEACAQCHQAQFEAWKHSRHAHAYSPGLVGQFPSMGHSNSNDCLVCHAPLVQQLYRDAGDMQATLATLLRHPEGFSSDADLDSKQAALPLRHAGVTCAVCHVRNGQRFGPPRRNNDEVGHLNGAAHGGFTATKDFEKSQFCAACHQFPQSYAIHGKPLENTVYEWKQSYFASEGVQCQGCHMPDRVHAFKGIHDKQMVLSGLDFQLEKQGDVAVLKITSKHIGHAFPTYVTPKVMIHAEAFNQHGVILQTWQWEIVRKVAYENGWKEIKDARLMPNQSRMFTTDGIKGDVAFVKFYVDVIPDAFYKGVYQNLLAGDMQPAARKLIQKALADAEKNDYRLFEGRLSYP